MRSSELTDTAVTVTHRAAAKRAFDVAASLIGLVISSPLLAAVAIAVRAESKGGAVFRQERVGRFGRPFRIHKFRTMQSGRPGPLISSAHDARITPLGAVLRRTKLDELPQLLDVLVGNMSLVGPRPEVADYVRLWPAEAREIILSVRPGVTDPATVLLRNESEQLAEADDPEDFYVTSLLPRKTALYVAYVQNRSFVGDLHILLQTLRAVIRE